MFYTIIPYTKSVNSVYLPENLYESATSMINFDIITVQAGYKKVKAKIKKSSNSSSEVVISQDILSHLSIPLDIKYQVKIENKKIRIGPVIGLLMAKKEENLTEAVLDKFLVYALLYPKYHGLLYIFSEDGIKFHDKETSGFYFNINKDNNRVTWENGTFPIADCVYRRISLSRENRRRLKDVTKNHMFNSYYFDKLEFLKMILKSSSLMEFIPETRLFCSFDDLEYVLKKYGSAYLKLIDGSLGYGIIRIEKIGIKYHFRGKEDDQPIIFKQEEIEAYLEKACLYKGYLVQQGIKCLRYEERSIDFRVIMQKKADLNWSCTGIVASFGKKGGICSNYIENALYMTFEEAIGKVKGLGEKEIFGLKGKTIEVCAEACRLLDSSGECYADVGIDVAIDENLKIWVLEINKEHDHRVPLFIKDQQMYYTVKNNPIKFAVAFSGFEI